jgi:hemolysin activation/secretion protein
MAWAGSGHAADDGVRSVGPGAASGAGASKQADVPPPPRFDIARFDVQGNTLLPAADITAAVSQFTGKSKDFGDVQRALESLQARYRRAGYGTVQVLLPEQELERGVIILRVIEPKLGKVTVEGNKFFSNENIRRSVPALKEGSVPNSNQIGRDARLANQNPAKSTTVLLRAGDNENEVDATLRVRDERPWRAAVSLDNTGTPASGKYRLGLAYQHSNLFDRDHTLTVQYLLDPEEFDQLKIMGAGYRVPLYGRGASLDFLAGYSSLGSASSQVISGQAFSIAGSGTIFGVRYNQMLPRVHFMNDYEHSLSLGLDYKAYSNQTALVTSGVPGTNLTPDVTVHPLSLTYSGTQKMKNAEFSFYASVAHNIYPHGPDGYREKFSGPVPPDGEGAARGVGRPTYTVWRYGFNYVRAFANDMQTRLNVSGQWTRDALVAGEQFGIGGWNNLRGMLEREAALDYGVRGSFELYSPDVAPKLGWDGAKLRFLGFIDSGTLRQNFCPNTSCQLGATSVGVGVRLYMRNNVSLRLDYGQMLDAGAEGDSGDDRVHFGLAVTF